MTKAKLISALTLILIALILILQNTEPVDTKILFLTITMSRAALLAITMLIGVITGILLSLHFTAKRTRKK